MGVHEKLNEQLKGLEFKYDSPTTGLSTWTGVVKNIVSVRCMSMDRPGFKLEFYVKAEGTNNVYELQNVVFLPAIPNEGDGIT
jgi:hypothetical protein